MVKIENTNRNTVILEQGKLANNFFTRLKGLVGTKELHHGEGLMIEPCRGVHCMFMSMPIDVIYVDKENKVVALDKAMAPWAVGKIYRQSRYVIELPPGTIEQTGTQPGDQLQVKRV
jgi:uncharacterized membrane protein (UPF0127 family)